MERALASLSRLQQGSACQPYGRRREQTPRPCVGSREGAPGRQASTKGADQQRETWLQEARPATLRARLRSENRGAPSGGNDGLMESVEDRTIRLSGLPLFPQPLEITKCCDFAH